MGTVQWLMIPVSRFKYLFLSLLVILLGVVGLIGGRAYFLAKHPGEIRALTSAERTIPASAALAPSAPNPPMPAGSGVFDQIAAEVSGCYEQAAPTVVRLRRRMERSSWQGQLFIDGQGTILTAYAVVGQADTVSVEVNGRNFPAKVVGRDPRSGVAVLKIQATQTPHLAFGEGMRLRPASAVVSVAFPYDLKAEPTFGFVAGFDVKYLTRFFATTHLRANLPIKPGQIGGPLLDSQGKVVGVLMLEIDEGKACYALPIEAAAKVAGDIQKYGEPRHGWMGVGVMPDRSRPERGAPVFVDRLYKGTPAEKSGLKDGRRGDFDWGSVGGGAIRCFRCGVFFGGGGKVPVKVKRDGKEQIFTITVSVRPDSSRIVEPAPLFPNPSGGPANQGMPVKASR